MDYLYVLCDLAAAFAGFTAIVTVLHPDSVGFADEFLLNKLRLRQMLEISLFTIAAGLAPQVIESMGVSLEVAMRIAGGLFTAGGLMLMAVQAGRGASPHLRALPGYSMSFFRLTVSLGALSILAFLLAASGVTPASGSYYMAVTLCLAIAALQFLRTAVSVLRLHGTSTGESADA